jgi:hypothetical protein
MITGILVSAVRYWIEMKEKTKNGKPIRKPNDVRKILIRGDFTATLKEKSFYRTASVAGFSATIVKRKGEVYVSVYALVKPAKPYWDHSPIKESELKRKPMDKFGFPEFEKFLSQIGIQNAASVMGELRTRPTVSGEEGQAEIISWEHKHQLAA